MKQVLLAAFAFVLLYSPFSIVHAAPAPVPQTGQTLCFNSIGAEIPCAGTGQDGDIKSGVAWPDPRFSDNGNGTVSDNLTGLMWTKDANAPGPTACAPAVLKTWQGALDYAACLNANSYLGYADWRVPSIRELGGLMDTSRFSPALTAGHPFGVIQDSSGYWSSSTYYGTDSAWVVIMYSGNLNSYTKTTRAGHVWPVRSGELSNTPAPTPKTGQTSIYAAHDDGALQTGVAIPSPRFTDNLDGSVTDNLTGLTWLKNANCFADQTWDIALDKSNTLASGSCGLTDGSEAGNWRLPNKNELWSLVDYGCSNPALTVDHPFSNVQSGINYYWSSSNLASGTNYASTIHMFDGMVVHNYAGISYFTWPVRSEQFSSLGSIIFSVSATDFRNILVKTSNSATSQVRLRNSGASPSAITAINLTGVTPSHFTVVPGGSTPCSSMTPTLAAGAACTLLVTAAPTTTGAKTANLTITTSTGSKDIPLTANAYSTVLGTITDMSTGLPISGATVALNTGANASTNANGIYNFSTTITPGTYSITVSKTGYQSLSATNLIVSSAQNGIANLILPTTGPLNITTIVLPSATAGTAYSRRVTVSGGTYPYTFTKSYGTMPTGLNLDPATGIISGTPSGSGSYTFAIAVTDNLGASSEQEYSLDLTAPLVITTTTLPRGTTGSNYPASVTATGGKAPLSLAVTNGTLPTGVTLSANGTFTGSPTLTGNFPITVTVTDTTGRTSTQNLTISIDAPLVITTTRLDDAKQGIAYTFTPTTSGGYGAKNWTLYAGILPTGLNFDTAAGTISGTPTEITGRVITLLVTDGIGRTSFKSYPLNVTVPLGFSSTKLPNAPLNFFYSEKVQATGGNAPYTFSMTGTLPTGLTYDNTTGIVSGTGTSASTKNISITVTDNSYPTPQSVTQTFSIRVTSLISPATSAVLTNARKGSAITPVTFAASGGTAPYTWSHIGGALPGGVTFNPITATLSGTPSDAGDFTFTLHLSDSVGNQTGDTINPDKVFTLHVSDTLTVTTSGLPTAALNIPYSATLTSTGGLRPITWRVSTGVLPTGITLDATTGQLSGTPIASSATVTFEAADSETTKQTATKQLTISVSSTLTIIESVLPDARTSGPYGANIRAQFGTAPYSWRISSGTLPDGLSLSSTSTNATISGTPTTAGTATFTVEVTDSSATPQKVIRQFTLTTQGVLAITTSNLPSLTSGQPYTAMVATTGGAAPYNFTLTSGALPQGIFLNSASGVISGTSSTTGGSSFAVTVTDSGIPSQSVSQAYTLAALVVVSVTKSEAAAGTITSIPSGVSCDIGCTSTSGLFAAGTSVTLTAVPAAGYYLAAWNGCDTTNANTCTVSARTGLGTITASFSRMSLTQTSLDISSAMILQAGSVTVSGKVTPLPDHGGDLTGLLIDVTITSPDASFITLHTNSDASGHYLISSITGFTQKGAYLIRAHFTGSTTLTQSTSLTQSVFVGSQAGYAILVQGKIPNGEGLTSHNKTANKIYKTLKARGFNDESILYLSYQTSQETAAAGVTADGVPSRSAVQNAITIWAAAKLQDIAAPLYIILVDHGSEGNFIINSETITPTDLNDWLTTVEGGLNTAAKAEKRIIINGSCYSGGFIPTLSKAGRVVITSATDSEESYKGPMEPDGIRSGEYFLDTLFSELKNGHNLEASFAAAATLIRTYTRKGGSSNGIGLASDGAVQHPLLDDDGSKTGTNIISGIEGDGIVAKNIYLGVGATLTNSGQSNDIKAVTPTSFLDSKSSTLQLWLTTVGSHSAVSSAWAEVRSPSLTLNPSGTSTAQLDLTLDKQLMKPKNDTSNQWELPTPYSAFTTSGTYEIYYYTRDAITGDISSMMRSVVYKNMGSNISPTVATLTSPPNSSTQKTMIIFEWIAVNDPEANQFSYTLEIATDNAFTNIVHTQENITVTAAYVAYGTLNDLTTYFWRIKAIDQFGAFSTSMPYTFNTDNTNGLVDSIVTGTILNSTSGSPLPAASVQIGEGSGKGLFAGNRGIYLFSTPASGTSITVKATGYKPKTIPITLTAGNVFSASIYLEPVIQLHTLGVTVTGTGSGTVNSVPSGVACDGTGAGCNATYSHGTPITLTAFPSTNSILSTWGGTCSGKSLSCGLTLNADASVSANFIAMPPVKQPGTVAAYFDTITAAYSSCPIGGTVTFQAMANVFNENVTLERNINVTLQGGFDGTFASTGSGNTVIQGVLTVKQGRLTVRNVVVR
ncbi:MAG: putative Ig domain-containing protein [Desulfuromonadaceae bacterium]